MVKKYVVGIDEVGRGSLAGPVIVVAAMMPMNSKSLIANSKLGTLKDSKGLTAKQREAWSAYFLAHPKIEYALARVYPRTIERINIANATNLAAFRATKRLIAKGISQGGSKKRFAIRDSRHAIYLDGGLYLGSKKAQPKHARTIIGGDESITSIKVASIIAKVNRDRSMVKLAKKYPKYGFEIHKGYGTKRHMAAIKKYGASKVHRKTFIANV
ncbi:MAG: ribonuclease HII [bacterium]|nr:ribonuclease HII [bacterium]